MMQQYHLTKDRFRQRRGGYSRLLDVRCRRCKGHVAMYQKDGAGTLRRLYYDRILDRRYISARSIRKPLQCRKCQEILGTPLIYKKERRRAFRLYQDAVVGRIRRSRKG